LFLLLVPPERSDQKKTRCVRQRVVVHNTLVVSADPSGDRHNDPCRLLRIK
jgi:hypothetical protein